MKMSEKMKKMANKWKTVAMSAVVFLSGNAASANTAVNNADNGKNENTEVFTHDVKGNTTIVDGANDRNDGSKSTEYVARHTKTSYKNGDKQVEARDTLLDARQIKYGDYTLEINREKISRENGQDKLKEKVNTKMYFCTNNGTKLDISKLVKYTKDIGSYDGMMERVPDGDKSMSESKIEKLNNKSKTQEKIAKMKFEKMVEAYNKKHKDNQIDVDGAKVAFGKYIDEVKSPATEFSETYVKNNIQESRKTEKTYVVPGWGGKGHEI